jgi:hypothetical protein
VITPLALALGSGVLSYGLHLRRVLYERPDNAHGQWKSPLAMTIVSIVIAIGVFGVLGDWAAILGRASGRQLAEHLTSRPSVAIFAKEQLQLSGKGITVSTISGGGEYRFRYSGLRLLIYAEGKYLLVPKGWSHSDGQTIVLSDTSDMRLEFAP